MLAALAASGPARAAENGLTVSHPWIRFIIPARPAAGYFTLTNDGAAPRTLVGAASPACGTLMLHQSIMKNGQDRMVMVERIEVPAHGKIEFAPGGYHLMCMAPTKDMKHGRSVPVTLRFADGTTLAAPFPVRNAMGR